MKNVLFAIMAVLFLFMQNVMAQENEANPWTVNCGSQVNNGLKLICEVTQSIVIAESNQRLASVSFVKLAGQDEIEVILTLPFGLSLNQNPEAIVDDGESIKFEYETCEAQGCLARVLVSKKWHSLVRKGLKLKVNVLNRNGGLVTFEFDLTGISKMLDLLP